MRRVHHFIKRYLFRNPLYIFGYGLALLRPRFVCNTRFYSEHELLAELKQGKSLLRIGDGEINLLLGLRNHYQAFDKGLQTKMWAIVQECSDGAPYIVSVPRFVNVPNAELRKMGKLYVWLPLKVMFSLYFNKATPYLDAHSFYYDGYFERVVGPYLQERKVFLVTRKETIEHQLKNERLPFTFTPIVTPDDEMLSREKEIRATVLDAIRGNNPKTVTVLFAAGPVGKAIAHSISKQGIQCLDIGKVAEVMYRGDSIESLI